MPDPGEMTGSANCGLNACRQEQVLLNYRLVLNTPFPVASIVVVIMFDVFSFLLAFRSIAIRVSIIMFPFVQFCSFVTRFIGNVLVSTAS